MLPRNSEKTAVTAQLMTIQDIARLYQTSEAAIRMAIWRQRHEGKDPGIPMPFMVRRRYRWLQDTVMQDLQQRGQKNEIAMK